MTALRPDLVELCDDALRQLPEGAARDAVLSVRANLQEPLQVTIAGGVSSGKSTLVNALLGQRIAAVDAGECTQVVTRFTYSHHERAEIVLHDGSTRNLGVRGGSLPSELGVPVDSVREVVVHLSNAGLRHLSIVDTPGLDTVTTANQARTEGFLGLGTAGPSGRDTTDAIGRADALVFLMPHLRRSDADVLGAFRELYTGSGLSAFNSLAVISKVDQLSRDGDPIENARPIAHRIREEARGLVSAVLPIVGLLAETAACTRLDESDARALETLAAFGDDLDREDLLLSPEGFFGHDGADVPAAIRKRLFDRLGLHGLALTLGAIDDGHRGAVALLRIIDERSGLAPLRHQVLHRLGSQADLIKSHTAVCDLRRISYRRGTPQEEAALVGLRSPLDRFELDPTLHRLRIAEVLQEAATGSLRLPEPLLVDLDRLVSTTDPVAQVGADSIDDIAAGALGGAARWGRWANDPRRRPTDARHGRAVKAAYEMIWHGTQNRTGSSA